MNIVFSKLGPVALAAVIGLAFACRPALSADPIPDGNAAPGAGGRHGGRLIVAQRAEPKTFNPVSAIDTASREVLGLMIADLVHINRRSLRTESAIAESWTVSAGGRRYKLHLRRGVRFSDGHPMDADDVVFTLQAYLDSRNAAPQRDLLIINGKPIAIHKIDAHTVEFELSAAYAAADRLFDGIAILPRHLLLKAHEEGRLGPAWGLDTTPDRIAGLGPFRLKQYVPGQRVVLQRNPYYWKTDPDGRKLPYLDEVVFELTPNEDVQILQFLAGRTHVLTNLSPANFLELKKQERERQFSTYDVGAGLEFSFLLFNLNEAGDRADSSQRRRLSWFQSLAFRRAISSTIDREAIVRLVYRNLADPLWTPSTQGNRLWFNRQIPRPRLSVAEARQLLKSNSFSWRGDALLDPGGSPVEFSILASASNLQRTQIANLIQQDLRQLGIAVSVVSLEFRSMLDRVLNQLAYDTAIMTLASGDADPNSEMNVWLSSGSMHFWNLNGKRRSPWEEEIDGLMRLQMTTLAYPERKRLYDRVQWLIADKIPIVCLASPHVLVAANNRVGGFDPAILRSNALWNVESLYMRTKTHEGR